MSTILQQRKISHTLTVQKILHYLDGSLNITLLKCQLMTFSTRLYSRAATELYLGPSFLSSAAVSSGILLPFLLAQSILCHHDKNSTLTTPVWSKKLKVTKYIIFYFPLDKGKRLYLQDAACKTATCTYSTKCIYISKH